MYKNSFNVKDLTSFILIQLTIITMQAQTKTDSPAGEYYLRGVMETAAGFKLNEDHTFNFFFKTHTK